jgi:hypothetical protein
VPLLLPLLPLLLAGAAVAVAEAAAGLPSLVLITITIIIQQPLFHRAEIEVAERGRQDAALRDAPNLAKQEQILLLRCCCCCLWCCGGGGGCCRRDREGGCVVLRLSEVVTVAFWGFWWLFVLCGGRGG